MSSKLASIRKNRGLSQQALAAMSGVPQQTVSSIENGFRKNPRIHTLKQLAAALECSVEDLIDDEPAKEDAR